MDRTQLERLLIRRANRRRFLTGGLGLVGLLAAVSLPGRPTRAAWIPGTQATPEAAPVTNPTFTREPFSLGVASGDPLPDNVVLWTRLAPDPLNGGGVDPVAIEVRWEIARDEGMAEIVQSGTAAAVPELAHSVHIDATGLEPGTEYYYRFMAGDAVSPVGRTKTAPARDAAVDRFAFAYASCQNWEAGYYPAYRHMAQDDLDLVIHLGDYIYEGGARPTAVRFHTGNEISTLDDYRNRHALYKTDPDLQAAHAAFPWLFTWDDHEVDNNWASDLDQDGTPPTDFLPRRAVGFQAYYEHLPLRPEHAPRGDDMLLYRRFTFGTLAEFSVLDTRQYRSSQACDDGFKVPCAETLEEERTMTGPEQERWLLDGLDTSTATWNVIAQQTIMASFDYDPTDAELFNHDQWDGYPAARNRILGHIMQTRPSNPVVITGDWHSSWVNDLKADFRDVESETLATEFVGTSISSGYPGDIQQAEKALAANPHIKFFNGDLRGYVRATLTPDQWQADYQLLDSVRTREVPIQTRASFIVENGRPGAQRL